MPRPDLQNISLPPDWWEAFCAAAAKDKKSVSEWLRDAGAEKLPAKVRAKLSKPRTVGRPKKTS